VIADHVIQHAALSFCHSVAARKVICGGDRRAEVLFIQRADVDRRLADHNLLDEEHLNHIKQPVQIIVGDQDNTVTIRESTHAVKSLPHAQAQILTDTPHPFERVPHARLAQSLIEFFS
jgi:pimeloyl-ACP methyl ester carboxylesterase